MNYMSLLANPGAISRDGIYTVGLTTRYQTHRKTVPFVDMHELGKPSLGFATITAVPVGKLNDDSYACTFIADIATNERLKIGQHVSMSYGVTFNSSVEGFGDIHVLTLDDIIEVSLVDISQIPNTQIINPTDLNGILRDVIMPQLALHAKENTPLLSAILAADALAKAKSQPQQQSQSPDTSEK